MRALLLALVLGLAPALAAAAEPPAAMVMAASGKTTPPVAAMSELAAGAQVVLAPGAEITLLHYARCKMITVAGSGTLAATRTEFLTDGKIVAEAPAPCPRIHRLSGSAAGAVSGGLVMRGIAATPRWPLNRELVIAGEGSDTLKAAAIFAEERPDSPLVRLEIAGRRARYPEGAPTLAENAHYLLRLTLGGRAEPVDIAFTGAAPSGPSLLVVLRGR